MGRAAHAAHATPPDNWAMPTLDDQIDALLSGRAHATRSGVEETLTTGYAHALDLEAERARALRTLRESSRADRRTVADASERLEDAERELARLRGLLARLRRHVYDPLVAADAR
jgi:hypothetical protein